MTRARLQIRTEQHGHMMPGSARHTRSPAKSITPLRAAALCALAQDEVTGIAGYSYRGGYDRTMDRSAGGAH